MSWKKNPLKSKFTNCLFLENALKSFTLKINFKNRCPLKI